MAVQRANALPDESDLVRPHRWTRAVYDKMVECGILGPEDRVELLDGEIFTLPPISPEHSTATKLAERTLEAAFGPAFHARAQFALALDASSEPEPDVAIVKGDIRDYAHVHPGQAVLVAEVSVSTRFHDRKRKASLYARDGVTDYWIIDPIGLTVDVLREPVRDVKAIYGWSFHQVQRHAKGDILRPLAKPDARVAVADLLP